MCGRYTLHLTELAQLRELFGLSPLKGALRVANWRPRYNIAPSQDAPVVLVESGERLISELRWGLVPSWADAPSIGTRAINARVETIDKQPMFRGAFAQRRCVVPATGFFEWRSAGARAPKEPLWIRPSDGSVVAFAGIWEEWHSRAGEVIESFAIVTTDALGALREIHDRMPLELRGSAIDTWLAPGPLADGALAQIVSGATVDGLIASEVDPRVSSPFNDDPGCIGPPSPPDTAQLGLFD